MRINKKTDGRLDVVMCNNCANCPSVLIDKDIDTVVLGGKEEGFSEWTKGQFRDLVNNAKDGLFDEYIGEGK